MKRPQGSKFKSFLLYGVSALFAAAPLFGAQAHAQDAAQADDEDIIVVGTQIRGAQVTDVLPVTVLSEADIEAIAPTSGDDLFRAIPQAGDVTFNEARLAGGINDARGDTASINLRGIGTGNTLMLINGRRMVLHPAIQVENLVPVATVNTNTIPVAGVRRLEVLRDGASAIYGTDAVAGVINTVLRDNFEGFRIELEGSHAADSNMDQFDLSFEAGWDLNGGRTNISVFGNFTNRDPLFASERDYAASADLRPLVNDPQFAALAGFRNTSVDTPWPELRRVNTNAAFSLSTTGLSINGTTITSTSAGSATFHIQPNTNAGCLGGANAAGAGVCYDNSVLATTGDDENLRYDDNFGRTIWGGVDRSNLFLFVNHELRNGMELFGELGGYSSRLESMREQETNLSTQRLIVPATNFWNPFGPTMLNGAANPNRAAVTNAPAGGVSFELQDYRVVDAGLMRITVDQYVGRALVGLRGDWSGWDWETAYLYSRAETNDTMYQPSMTLFQDALSRSDSTAYNPFTGGDPAHPSYGDASPNPQSVIDSFMVDIERVSHTSIAQWDLRVSRPDLLSMWAGNIGAAAGIELRRETYGDDRDPRLDGTISFDPLDDAVSLALLSDVMGASPTPDTSGARNVQSAFVEFAVPLVSPDMNIPLVTSLEMQLAARYENYTFFGSVTKPKVALAWRPFEWVMFRSSWSEGFRAPNLPQQFERGILRSNTRSDWIRCEARQQAGSLADFSGCGGVESVSVQSNRSGSETLQPETSENFTAGIVLEPRFMRDGLGQFTFTADFWSVEQDGVIGLLGDSNALTLDYLLRMQGDTNGNENVIRTAANAGDDTLFAGAVDNLGNPLASIGTVLQVVDNYRNLGPREVEGYDIGVFYNIDDTILGDFNLRLNYARLLTFYQAPGPEQQQLLDAQGSGAIDPFPTVPGAESLIEQDGLPKTRASATLTWRSGNWGAGTFSSYVGGVDDTGVRLAIADGGTAWRVRPWVTHNLYVQYTLDSDQGFLDTVRLRLGARNIMDEDPPLADTSTGYIGDLHSPRGRTVYFSVRSSF